MAAAAGLVGAVLDRRGDDSSETSGRSRNARRPDGVTGPMVRAMWNGEVIAESDDTVVVEGNHYFPPEAVDRRYLRESTTESRCPWKGTASYYSVVVAGEENHDAAWYYPEPSPAAREIAGRIAFWRGVTVERARPESAGEPAGTPAARRPALLGRLRGR